MEDQRGPYFRSLVESARERSYWVGPSPENPDEQWMFETVQDGDDTIAIRQVTVGSGQCLGYSADHLEDADGFLTDQPLQPMDWGLDKIAAEAFEDDWGRRTNVSAEPRKRRFWQRR